MPWKYQRAACAWSSPIVDSALADVFISVVQTVSFRSRMQRFNELGRLSDVEALT